MARITKNPDDIAQLARELRPEVKEQIEQKAREVLRNIQVRAAAENRKNFVTLAGARALAELMFFAEAFDG
jgi:hypothetical protein